MVEIDITAVNINHQIVCVCFIDDNLKFDLNDLSQALRRTKHCSPDSRLNIDIPNIGLSWREVI